MGRSILSRTFIILLLVLVLVLNRLSRGGGSVGQGVEWYFSSGSREWCLLETTHIVLFQCHVSEERHVIVGREVDYSWFREYLKPML
jgi:hypothetical protein